MICCQRLTGTSKRGKNKHDGDDIMMADTQDETMAEPMTQTSDSEQWSLFETLKPLAEAIIQEPVSILYWTFDTPVVFQNRINIDLKSQRLSVLFYTVNVVLNSINSKGAA